MVNNNNNNNRRPLTLFSRACLQPATNTQNSKPSTALVNQRQLMGVGRPACVCKSMFAPVCACSYLFLCVVNDDHLPDGPWESIQRRGMERMLRKLLQLPSRPAVLLVHMFAYRQDEPCCRCAGVGGWGGVCECCATREGGWPPCMSE